MLRPHYPRGYGYFVQFFNEFNGKRKLVTTLKTNVEGRCVLCCKIQQQQLPQELSEKQEIFQDSLVSRRHYETGVLPHTPRLILFTLNHILSPSKHSVLINVHY